jgi:hypothetical protein
MRMFIVRRVADIMYPDCQVFRLAVVRRQAGAPSEQVDNIYLTLPPPDIAALNGDGQEFLVADLPINTPAGLNIFTDLAPAQLLSFGLEWYDVECRPEEAGAYKIYAIEFFESAVGTDVLSGVTVSLEEPVDCLCPGGES